MTPALLQVRDLHVHFPSGRRSLFGHARAWTRAVDGASFDLHAGESLGLVGESGCGKSTLARALVGLQHPTSGSIRFDGTELTDLSSRGWKPIRRRMQMVFQDPYASLDPRQTVASILAEPLAIQRIGRPRQRRIRALELLEAVGLSPGHLQRYPHEFSGGQRQRIGIARALALEPELLICDEPVSALDVSIQAQIINLLRDLQERFELAYLFIAHDLAVVRYLCTRVAVMYSGRIVETAERSEIFEDARHPYTRALLAAIPQPCPQPGPQPSPQPGQPPPRSAASQRLQVEAASPAAPEAGCPYYPRCPERERVPEDRCAREAPELSPRGQGGSGRECACHLRP